jgi:imidazolonepropionase-like amidohydrolase
MTTAFTVDECWAGGWLGRTALVAEDHGFRLATDADPAPEAHLPGTVLPGFRDAHVHLGLVDGSGLLAGGIAAVHDFGWTLELARNWPDTRHLPAVSIAGQFLTARGGYPSSSAWAPRGAVLELDGPDDASVAVDSQLTAGASFIKVVLNTDAGPVLDDPTLSAIVAHAHDRGTPVAAHVEGTGQAARAFDAGVDLFAHTPWSEHIGDELLAAMAGRMSWISTLDIHGWGAYDADFARASDNLRRFHAAGGGIRYGTDLGNGPLPVGINPRELLALEQAGLGLEALAAAIAPLPTSGGLGHRLSLVTAERDEQHPAAWLATARLIDCDTFEEQLT